MLGQSEMWPPEWEPLELAYFAGLFDGEGSLGIYSAGKARPEFRVSICNNDPRPLEKVVRLFGGTIRLRVRQYKTGLSKNWEWYIHGPRADRFLVAIHPSLIIKREQVDVYLATRRRLVGRGKLQTPEASIVISQAERTLKAMKRGT